MQVQHAIQCLAQSITAKQMVQGSQRLIFHPLLASVTVFARKLFREMMCTTANSKTLFSCFQIPDPGVPGSRASNKQTLDYRACLVSSPALAL